jgi:hypothetical protein
VLSPRRTFAKHISQVFGFDIYSDIEGDILLEKNPKLVIQIDSISRIKDIHKADLIVVDEIMSIITQMSCKLAERNMLKGFLRMIKQKATFIYMDGYLDNKTIFALQTLS